ncbi:SixA phosphatase family protein [Maliponia aquimaris]|uniref:Histidine phosphatase superfamily (Branch 1) n=1 Tax=Maliponia aquimaris TaxID=1673631 RepID=A0A238KAZ6_9RHOB|nr:histidine phosphatase family protein [Maliponia aquimaris]SMX39126.1 Histidine phosphatase superfamily (branch 1) [Maliponia aquimaris]
MKQLILTRHAKSDWGGGLPDHDRPLNARGRNAAAAIGDWLRAKEYLPDAVLCSSAARTRETLTRMQIEAPTRYDEALYHAAPQTMLTVLKGAEGDSVLMLGHNPGIGQLAGDLVSTPPDHPRFDAYPTAATLVVRFDIDDWSDLALHSGQVVDFIVPRDLTD